MCTPKGRMAAFLRVRSSGRCRGAGKGRGQQRRKADLPWNLTMGITCAKRTRWGTWVERGTGMRTPHYREGGGRQRRFQKARHLRTDDRVCREETLKDRALSSSKTETCKNEAKFTDAVRPTKPRKQHFWRMRVAVCSFPQTPAPSKLSWKTEVN